jgi:hypothetical protein
MTTNFPETDIETPTAPPPPLVKPDGRTPGGARRPDLNPTGFVHPDVVSDYNKEIIEGVKNPPGAHDGLLKDGSTGHLIGIEQQPFAAHPDVGAEYPKWIVPHDESHVSINRNLGEVRETGDWETEKDIEQRSSAEKNPGKSELKKDGDNLTVPRGAVVGVPGFTHHVRRHDGALMVLVHDEAEEKRAMGEHADTKAADSVSASERWEAESAYHEELQAKHRETSDKRIAEIVVERREAKIKQREKELEDERKSLDAVKSGKTSGTEPHRSEMFEVQAATKYQASVEHPVAAQEADAKIGPEDWTTRQGPVDVHPDKSVGNQGQGTSTLGSTITPK